MKILVMDLLLMWRSIIMKYYIQFQDLHFLIWMWLIFSMVSSMIEAPRPNPHYALSPSSI